MAVNGRKVGDDGGIDEGKADDCQGNSKESFVHVIIIG